MGLFDKVKNLFTDEVDEEPIKSEVIQVEIPAPAKEIKMVDTKEEEKIADNETIKSEEKVATPIFFDDEYFKELEQPKQEVKSSYLKEPPKLKEEKKHFRPTPIISPVYGVLDKNYNKEDITEKKERKVYETNTTITIDEVRKKAFGTLEDDLENTLFGKNSILFNESEKEEDLFDELIDEQEDDVEIMEEPINIVEEEMQDINMVEAEITKQNLVEEEMTRSMEENRPISESELFDLIDSMYEKGE